MASAVPPDRLFLPLLSAALAQGADPNLGRAQRLAPGALQQPPPQQPAEAATAPRHEQPCGGEGGGRSSDSSGDGEAPAGRPRGYDWGTHPSPGGPSGGEPAAEGGAPCSALLAEEVLMWHRAASRLGEMTCAGW
jgi:hypothetical protein